MIKKFWILFFILFCFCSQTVYAKKKITVYPNPWIPKSGKSLTDNNDQMRHGSYTADGWIKFRGVTASSGNLKIYDITGKLVRDKNWTIEEERAVPLPQTCKEKKDWDAGVKFVHWDGKDNDYNYVESGVYIWILRENGAGKHDGKVVVVR